MNPSTSFLSLAELKAEHRQLLEHRRHHKEGAELGVEIHTFIKRGQATGILLDSDEDRWDAQNLLDYWANELLHITGENPDASLAEFDPNQAPELDDSLCPYLGLDAFGTTEHTLFFGRDQLIDKMVEQLQDSRVLTIVGPSGSGKSSITLAGLLPRLQAGAIPGSETWRFLPPMVPGSNPLVNLARILQPDDIDSNTWIQNSFDDLQKSPDHLANLINESGQGPAVLIVDQFEEIFTLCFNDKVRHAFINNLLRLLQSPVTRHTVILTMRADFESILVQIPMLQALFEQAEVRVTAMKAAELRQVIESPANLIGLRFEDGLVNELVREVLGETAALPLLQFTLLKLWETRQRNQVTWAAYHRLGGGRQSLANSADMLYESLPESDQATARRILLALVRSGSGPELNRDRVLRQTLYQIGQAAEKTDRVLNQLIEAHLVRVIEADMPSDTQVEIVHETLISNWPRLVGWLEDERVARRRRARLTTMAEQWQAMGYDSSTLLRGLLLEEALRYRDLNEIETAFIETSKAAAHEERLAQEAAQQRELKQARVLADAEHQRAEESERGAKRLRGLTSVLVVVFAVTVLMALTAVRNGRIASQNEATANASEAQAITNANLAATSAAEAVANANLAATNEASALINANLAATSEAVAIANANLAATSAAEAIASEAEAVASANLAATREAEAATNAREAEAQSRLATARELAAAAIDQLNSDPQLSLLLALEAVNVTYSVNQTAPAEAEEALYRALQASQLQLTLSGHTDWVTDVAFSPDGTRLATVGRDTAVKIWDAASGQEILTLTGGHTSAVNSVTFNPDGSRLATASDDGLVIIWNAATGELLTALRSENNSPPRSIAFYPDGIRLAAAYEDTTVRVWNTVSRQSLFRLPGHTGPLNAVVFSPDGAQFATAGDDGRAIVWNAEAGTSVYSIPPETGADGEPVVINGLAFSPDGERLVTANGNGTAKVWDYKIGDILFTFSGHPSSVAAVNFNPDGTLLATASNDGTAKVWQANTGQVLYTLSGHSSGVSAVTFSPDGKRIATASQDGTVKVWNAVSSLDLLILSGHRAPVRRIVFSPDGSLAATASDDGTAKLWDTETGLVLHTFANPNNTAVTDVAFNHDGTLLATGSADWNGRIWDVAAQEVRRSFPNHGGPVNGVAFNFDSTLLATASEDGFVRIWNVADGSLLQRLQPAQPAIRITFSPDGTLLAAAGNDTAASIWEVATGQIRLTLADHEGPVNNIVFSRDGTLLATASGDSTAKIWDLSSGQLLRTFSGHTGPILAVAFSPDGRRLATASVDKTTKLWDARSGQALRTLLGHTSTIHSVTFSPDGLWLATASSDRTAQINKLSDLDELFERALGRVTRSLTAEECTQYLRGRPCLTDSP